MIRYLAYRNLINTRWRIVVYTATVHLHHDEHHPYEDGIIVYL